MARNTDTEVVLHLRRTKPPNGKGWIPVMSSKGRLYRYRYTGGNHANNGRVDYLVGQGGAEIVAKLQGAPSYEIEDLVLVDGGNQLTPTIESARQARIRDACTGAIEARYKITVLDTANGGRIPCDPQVINRSA